MTKPLSYYSRTTHVTLLSLALLAGSCSAEQADGDNKRSKLSAEQNQPTLAPLQRTKAPIPIGEMKTMKADEQALFARQDLAQRLGLELDDVSISGSTPVIWRSGALGCPKPGEQYTQALVKGQLLMLRVGNTAYRYHAIPTGEPFYCPDSQAEPPYTNSGDA